LGVQPCVDIPSRGLFCFTMFSHFLNVQRGASLWPTAGYNYIWVENKKCANPTTEDLFGNIFIAHGGAKVVSSASSAMTNLRGELRSGTSPNAYEQNFANDIRFVEFWPLT